MMAWQLQRVRQGHNPRVCAVCRRRIWFPLVCQLEAVSAGVVPRWQAHWLLGVPLPSQPGWWQQGLLLRVMGQRWRAVSWQQYTAAAVLGALCGALAGSGGRTDGGWGSGGWADVFTLQFEPGLDGVDVAAYAC